MIELRGDARHANFEQPISYENLVTARGWLADSSCFPPAATACEFNGAPQAGVNVEATHPANPLLTDGLGLNANLRPYKHFLVNSSASSKYEHCTCLDSVVLYIVCTVYAAPISIQYIFIRNT